MIIEFWNTLSPCLFVFSFTFGKPCYIHAHMLWFYCCFFLVPLSYLLHSVWSIILKEQQFSPRIIFMLVWILSSILWWYQWCYTDAPSPAKADSCRSLCTIWTVPLEFKSYTQGHKALCANCLQCTSFYWTLRMIANFMRAKLKSWLARLS